MRPSLLDGVPLRDELGDGGVDLAAGEVVDRQRPG